MAFPQENGLHLKRAIFTDPQTVQADYIGRVTEEHRQQRPVMRTHAIDNVTPEIAADRDDGIFVEVEPSAGKGYHVHVTIADVAAHVRPKSPLSDAAWQRAFTIYKPGSIDSMFPPILEQNLSLEHGQERLGLTVNIVLDEQFKPVHTSFKPVITMADNASYAQASTRIHDDPQFGLMAKIADGIKRSRCAPNDAAWNELMDDRRTRGGDNESEQKTMDMVAAYMLLANNCVAEFFKQSGVPFLYRNFDEIAEGHATYGTEPLGHSAIEAMGIQGAYCHITSPIRRAPDYFDGAMMHYVVDVMAEIEQKVASAYPSLDSEKLYDGLWEHGPEIMKLAGSNSIRNRTSLNTLLSRIVVEASPEDTVQERIRISLLNDLKLPTMPFTKSELDGYAEHMNALAHSSEVVRVAKEKQRVEESWERIEGIESKSRDFLSSRSPQQFSSILQAAAMTGTMPPNLFEETIARITSKTIDGLPNRNPNRTDDLFNVFIRAQFRGSEIWKKLKRVAANEIKKDPGLVNTLLYNLEVLVHPAEVLSRSNVKEQGDMQRPERVKRALIVLKREDGTQWAARLSSVGHDDRAARSHACYSFLEHYAFGELLPVEQTAIANELYAQLDMPGTKKLELLEQMVKDVGAEISIRTQKISSRRHITVTVSGGDVTVPIIETAEGKNEEDATKSALGHILRNSAFQTVLSRREVIGRELLNPQIVLEEELEKRGGWVDLSVSPVDSGIDSGFMAVAIVHLNGKETWYTATEPNKDRARRVVAAEALVEESLGSMRASAPKRVASWASEASLMDNRTGNSL